MISPYISSFCGKYNSRVEFSPLTPDFDVLDVFCRTFPLPEWDYKQDFPFSPFFVSSSRVCGYEPLYNNPHLPLEITSELETEVKRLRVATEYLPPRNLLGNNAISQQLYELPPETAHYFKIGKRDIWYKVGEFARQYENSEPALRGSIDCFSRKSRKRLKILAGNSALKIKSQFCMTYHNRCPENGEIAKKHLNSFLTWLRRSFPGVGYIWILEFQGRGVPHYHLFLTLDYSPVRNERLAMKWNQITGESEDHLWWHWQRVNKNKKSSHYGKPAAFTPWDMGSGNYLCKYLEKEKQKEVPESYDSVGRFWGNSRNMKPETIFWTVDDIARLNPIWDKNQIAHYFRKCLKKYHNHLLKPFNRSSRLNKSLPGACYIPNAADVFYQILNYVCEHSPDEYSRNNMHPCPLLRSDQSGNSGNGITKKVYLP